MTLLPRIKNELESFETTIKNTEYDDHKLAELTGDLGYRCSMITLEDMPKEIKEKGRNSQEWIAFSNEQGDKMSMKILEVFKRTGYYSRISKIDDILET